MIQLDEYIFQMDWNHYQDDLDKWTFADTVCLNWLSL